MPRTAAALALTLTLLTGIVLGQLRSLGSTGSFAMPVDHPHALQTATNFYDAINSLLETGDPSDLRSVMHSGFVDYSLSQQGTGSARVLEDSLLALRSTLPGLRFTAANIIVQGSIVASRLTATGNPQGVVNEIPVEFELPSAGYELLRIDDDRVIERWASPALPVPAQIASVATIDSIAPMISPRTPLLERLTLEQHARYDVSVHGGTILVVESGALSVHVNRVPVAGADPEIPEQESDSPGASFASGILSAGQTVTIPSRVSFRLANTDLQSATILSLTIPLFDHVDEPGSSTLPAPLPAGVTREMQASGFSIRPNQGPFTLEMYRILIPSGTAIANHKVAESELLLVDQGNIEVTIRHGQAGLLTEHKPVTDRSGNVTLSAGQGIAAPADAEVAYHATGQSASTLWLVTLTLVD